MVRIRHSVSDTLKNSLNAIYHDDDGGDDAYNKSDYQAQYN